MKRIKYISIIPKKGLPEAGVLANEVKNMLQKNGINVFVPPMDAQPEDFMPRLLETDLVLVLGGDGTMIRVARGLATISMQHSTPPPPVGGINLGGVGFLAELDPDSWKLALEKALACGLKTEKRMGLYLEVDRPLSCDCDDSVDKNTATPSIRSGYAQIASGIAVNDVVLSRGGLARLLAIDMFVDEERLAYVRADGVIVSTPTGSTGYTGSAGGPLLSPALHAYVVTAICPFLSQSMPVVITGDSTLTLTMRSVCANSFITIDGQEFIKLHTHDQLHIRGIADRISFASFGVASYYKKLRSSGIVRDSSGGPASDKAVCEDCN